MHLFDPRSTISALPRAACARALSASKQNKEASVSITVMQSTPLWVQHHVAYSTGTYSSTSRLTPHETRDQRTNERKGMPSPPHYLRRLDPPRIPPLLHSLDHRSFLFLPTHSSPLRFDPIHHGSPSTRTRSPPHASQLLARHVRFGIEENGDAPARIARATTASVG